MVAMINPGGGGGGRRGGRRRRGSAPMSEINVTPFVDVMLVLLIIFMVAAPFLTVGVPLDLPETRANALPRQDQEPVAVSVDAQGGIFFGEEPITLDALPARLAVAAETRGVPPEEERIYVRADDAADYGAVARLIGVLNANGYRRIALPTRAAEAVGAAVGDQN